ncbi:MAG: hypothetical protein HZA17_12900 [Nitrospirae bacterium]|nr:hypothetical protein [Nitrospirota bacterium]
MSDDHTSSLRYMRRLKISVAFFALLCCCTVPAAQGQEQTAAPGMQGEWVRVISPTETAEIVAQKPAFKIEFLRPFNIGTLVILLDGADITQISKVTETGIEFTPVMVIQAGTHTISLSATDKEGLQLQRNITFRSRHTKAFDEAYMSNEASLVYENVFGKPETVHTTPHSRLEGNLRVDTKIRDKGWQFTFNTNIRYLDQDIPVIRPFKKGFDAANWLFTGLYTKESLQLRTNIGDVQINETPYTVANFARKGGIFELVYDRFSFKAFSVMTEQVFGQRGGTGIEGNTDRHLLGVTGGVKLFDSKAELKAIYATGEDTGNSFNISGASGIKKGDVLGLVLNSDFFSNKMRTEFEADFSKFDPDLSDEFGSKQDKAYKIKAGGYLDSFSYEAMYEYVGRDYAAIGSQGLPRDREGFSMIGGTAVGAHAVNVALSRFHDNVRGDELFPRIDSYQGTVDYSLNSIPNLPLGINYQKSIQDSTREPSGTSPLEIDTDTLSGRVGYTRDKFMINAMAAYSLMNDKTQGNNDTTSVTYAVTPAYNAPGLSINPNLTLNQSKNHVSQVTTDTYTVNLDLRSRFFKERVSFDVGGTYLISKANNGSLDMRNLNANFRLSYNLQAFLKKIMKPSIGVRGTYIKITDRINPIANRDEFTLFLVLATVMPFSF